MSRTVRRNDPSLIQAIHRNRHLDETQGFIYDAAAYRRRNRRNDAILAGRDGAISYDKCQTANIDSEGGFKLNTWSECPMKHHGKEATRKRRSAGKNLIRRQLED